MRNQLFAALVLPFLAACAQPSQSAPGGGGDPAAPAAGEGGGQVTVELTQGEGRSASGQEQDAAAEGAPGGFVVRGTVTTPTPCHRLSGAVERSGGTVTLRVSAAADPEMMCIQSIGAIPYTATVRGLPAGSWDVRVLHTYPGTGWETATVLRARVATR